MRTFICCICLFIVSTVSAQMETSNTKANSSNTQQITSSQLDNIWDVIKERHSVRKFKSDPVLEADITKMIDAARLAPTSGNQQPWKFLVIRYKEKINKMKEACVNEAMQRYEQSDKKSETKEQYLERANVFGNYLSAPVYIIVLTDNNSRYPDYNHWDGPLAAGYLMLAARALGYGTVFITDAISEKVTKDVLEIPDNYTRVCIMPVGIPVEWPSPTKKKELNDFIVYEKF
jgi:nitroreductase